MDLRLLGRLRSVTWKEVRSAVELACGTGRVGKWLAAAGVRVIDGVDLTAEMLELARTKDVYRRLVAGDMRACPLVEMEEGLVDDAWVARKPKWKVYLHRPVSYALVWRKISD